jgi:hypothetical protein
MPVIFYLYYNFHVFPNIFISQSWIEFVMPEIRTINGMPNIPACSTIVSLKASDIIPITNYCTAVKLINNTESKTVGIKSLARSCNLKIKDNYITIISIDEVI